MKELLNWLNLVLFLALAGQAEAQYVGLNTSSPQADLHLLTHNTIKSGILVEGGSLSRFVGLRLSNKHTDGRSYSLLSTGGATAGGDGRLVIRDETALVNRLVIDSSGRVGVGLEAPQAALHIGTDLIADSSVVTKALLASSTLFAPIIQSTNLILGNDLVLTGDITALNGQFLLDVSGLSGEFVLGVEALTGDFNTVNADALNLDGALTAASGNFTAGDVDVAGAITAQGDLVTGGGLTVDALIDFSSPQLYYHNIPITDFVVEGNATNSGWVIRDGYGFIHPTGAEDTISLIAPVVLPDEAQVESIRVFYYDSTSTQGIDSVEFGLYALGKIGVYTFDEIMAGGSSTSSGTASNSVLSETVNDTWNVTNQFESMFVRVIWRVSNNNAGDKLRLLGMHVQYTVNGVRFH